MEAEEIIKAAEKSLEGRPKESDQASMGLLAACWVVYMTHVGLALYLMYLEDKSDLTIGMFVLIRSVFHPVVFVLVLQYFTVFRTWYWRYQLFLYYSILDSLYLFSVITEGTSL